MTQTLPLLNTLRVVLSKPSYYGDNLSPDELLAAAHSELVLVLWARAGRLPKYEHDVSENDKRWMEHHRLLSLIRQIEDELDMPEWLREAY